MEANLTITGVPPQWNSKPMYHLPPWGEPLVSRLRICVNDNGLMHLPDCPVNPRHSHVHDEKTELPNIRQAKRRLS